MTEEVKKKHVFLRNMESDEPAYHCGPFDDMDEVLESARNILAAELTDELTGSDVALYRFEIFHLTDQEVLDLPN